VHLHVHPARSWRVIYFLIPDRRDIDKASDHAHCVLSTRPANEVRAELTPASFEDKMTRREQKTLLALANGTKRLKSYESI